jgi:hypothetical protein
MILCLVFGQPGTCDLIFDTKHMNGFLGIRTSFEEFDGLYSGVASVACDTAKRSVLVPVTPTWMIAQILLHVGAVAFDV